MAITSPKGVDSLTTESPVAVDPGSLEKIGMRSPRILSMKIHFLVGSHPVALLKEQLAMINSERGLAGSGRREKGTDSTRPTLGGSAMRRTHVSPTPKVAQTGCPSPLDVRRPELWPKSF